MSQTRKRPAGADGANQETEDTISTDPTSLIALLEAAPDVDAGHYVAKCPTHKDDGWVVAFDIDEHGAWMTTSCSCHPYEVIDTIESVRDADVTETVRRHVTPDKRAGVIAGEQTQEKRRQESIASGTGGRFGVTLEEIERDLRKHFRDTYGEVRRDRYACPNCGKGTGKYRNRGVKIDIKDGKIVLFCHLNGCKAEEILPAAGLTFADIDVPRDPGDVFGFNGPSGAPDGNGNHDPGKYFGKGVGLLAVTLASDVLGFGPLAQGVDDRIWSYANGVWSPDKNAVRKRCAPLLGESFRGGHARTAEDVVRSRVRDIACDPVPRFINFRNGLLDWRAGRLQPHDPDVLTTVQLGVEYHPDAACPVFDRFLAEIVPADMVGTIWELIGYLMYSGNPLHKAVMCVGHGRNGKGTLLRVLVSLLGTGNVTTVSLHDLVNTRFSTANLFGKLANIAGDIDGGYLENTAVFKAITGGDTISAEHKGRDRFDFTPWAVPMFSANKIPASADTTTGYLSRWLVIPFPNDFTGREDRFLDGKLNDDGELRGIATRGVAALAGLLDRGDFILGQSARDARDEFTRRVDQVRSWLSECTEHTPEHWVYRTELYEEYKRWADRDGHRPVKASEFYDRLESAGAAPATVRGKRGFKGVRVTDRAIFGL